MFTMPPKSQMFDVKPMITYAVIYIVFSFVISKTTFLLELIPTTERGWLIIHSIITILTVIVGFGASINLFLWREQVAPYTQYLAPALLIGALLDALHLVSTPIMPEQLIFISKFAEQDLWFWLVGRTVFAVGLFASVLSFHRNPQPKSNSPVKNMTLSLVLLTIIGGLWFFVTGTLPPLEEDSAPTFLKVWAGIIPVILMVFSVGYLNGHRNTEETDIYNSISILKEKKTFLFGLHFLIFSQLIFIPSLSTNDYYSLIGHLLKLAAFWCFMMGLWTAVVTRSYQRIKSMLSLSVEALVEAIDSHEPSTSGHSKRVAEYATLIGKAYGLNDQCLERLWLAAILHDTGKIAIEKKILEKPGPLDEWEWVEIRKHPQNGQKIIAPLKLEWCERAILQHHERPDGKGYPQGLHGKKSIDIFSRIIAVADTFDAVVSHRHYRPAKTPEQARQIILEESGKQFDPDCVKAFERSYHDILRNIKSQDSTSNKSISTTPPFVSSFEL